MDDGNEGTHPSPPPSLVSLPFPFSPSARRRLSTTFVRPALPLSSSERPMGMAWISLQGRIVNAELASSSRTIGLTGYLALAWDLFPPIHRFIIVAVIGIGVAVAQSHKNHHILQLNKSLQQRFNTLTVEPDIYNLKRDCEQKDTAIKELTTLLNSSEVANNKVVQLSRLRRPSYYMESTTSPSSSDSDSTPVNNAQDLPLNAIVKKDSASGSALERCTKSQSMSLLKEASAVRKSNATSSSQKQLSPRDLKKSRWQSLGNISIPSTNYCNREEG